MDDSPYDGSNPQMHLAWQFIAGTGVSVFLTGKAGTGKTTFLRKLRELMPKRMVVLAPTGVAAINAGGQTIHSFFQLQLGPFVPGAARDTRQAFRMPQSKKDLIRTLDLLVIDEVSMVRADLLDQVDDALRRLRDRTRPFGGVQLLLIGDLMQLAPVAKADEWAMLSPHYDNPYFFSSLALRQIHYATVELTHIYRQQDPVFIDLLARVRSGRADSSVTDILNSRCIPGFRPPADERWIHITTHNAPAQSYNDSCLRALPGHSSTLTAEVEGDFPEMSYPVDRQLLLKPGAQVMFVKNDPAHQYYNGKIGTVQQILPDMVVVHCDEDGTLVQVRPVSWDNTRYTLDAETKEIRQEVAGTFRQYPLRLAWAITVHKSQGLTFDRAVLDINAAFTHGQVYVALSRCRTLRGMVLTSRLSPGAVRTDTTVDSYISSRAGAAEADAAALPRYKAEYVTALLDELYDFTPVTSALAWVTRVVDEYLSRQKPLWLERLKQAMPPYSADIPEVARRFAPVYRPALQDGAPLSPQLLERISRSADYFREKIDEHLTPLIADSALTIGNKRVAQIYTNAVADLRRLVAVKRAVFAALRTTPFSVSAYLQAKAKALIEAEGPAAPRRRRTANAGKK